MRAAIQAIAQNCGVFWVPQLALSAVVLGILLGHAFALLRGERARCAAPWRQTVDPLAAIAVSVGLLGSVVGFCLSFASFKESGDVDRLTSDLSLAYYTTGVGLVSSLVASAGVYCLDLLDPHREGVRTP